MKTTFLVYTLMTFSAFAASPIGLESIKLPPGYTIEHGVGTDSYVGTIKKTGGLLISIDSFIGVVPPRNPERMREFLSIREIRIGDQRVDFAVSGNATSRRAIAYYYPLGVQFSTAIDSDTDLAEFIGILSTYIQTRNEK